MFSTQNSLESPPPASGSINSNRESTSIVSTPSPVGNSSNRNSLSGQHSATRSTASIVLTPTAANTTMLSSLTRSLTHGDVRCDIDLSSMEANSFSTSSNANIMSHNTAINKNDLHTEGGAVAPYHRSMINVCSNSSEARASSRTSTVAEKSLSHADLTKSNELTDHTNRKTLLGRVNSSEGGGVRTKHENKSLYSYSQSNPQHGRSQSLMEIAGNTLSSATTKGNLHMSDAAIKNCFPSNDHVGKKMVSDRSKSSSALITTPSLIDESSPSKSNSMAPKLIETRRRHTLTKLKGIISKEINFP